jgi:hypothetical protein
MDEKAQSLKAEWEAAQGAVRRAEAVFAKAERKYLAAVEAGNRVAMSEAAKARSAAADDLHRARLRCSELRLMNGYDSLQQDSLRRQAGQDYSQGSISKLPGYGF